MNCTMTRKEIERREHALDALALACRLRDWPQAKLWLAELVRLAAKEARNEARN